DPGNSAVPLGTRQQGQQKRHHDQYNCGRWQQPTNSSYVKLPNRNATSLTELFEQDPCNQVPGYDEEDVHANVAARKSLRPYVEHEHRENGDCSQSLNFKTEPASGETGDAGRCLRRGATHL